MINFNTGTPAFRGYMIISDSSRPREILNISHPSLRDRTKGVIDAVIRSVHREKIDIPLTDEELSLLIERAHRNAMEHGNMWNPKKIITVKVLTEAKTLIIEILDESPIQKIEKAEDLRKFFHSEAEETAIIRRYCEPFWNEKGNILQLKIPLTQSLPD